MAGIEPATSPFVRGALYPLSYTQINSILQRIELSILAGVQSRCKSSSEGRRNPPYHKRKIDGHRLRPGDRLSTAILVSRVTVALPAATIGTSRLIVPIGPIVVR